MGWRQRLWAHVRDHNRDRWLELHPSLDGLPTDLAWRLLRATKRDVREQVGHSFVPWVLPVGISVIGLLIARAVLDDSLRLHLAPWWRHLVVAAILTPIGILGYVARKRLRQRNDRAEALFSERVAQQRAEGRSLRCLECCYDLRGTTSERCPECGSSPLLSDWKA